jgi:hypothetical protein
MGCLTSPGTVCNSARAVLPSRYRLAGSVSILAEKKNDILTVLCEINPIAGTEGEPEFKKAAVQTLRRRKVSGFHAQHRSSIIERKVTYVLPRRRYKQFIWLNDPDGIHIKFYVRPPVE